MQLKKLIPLTILAGLLALAGLTLSRLDLHLDSGPVLIDLPVPDFAQPEFSSADLRGRITLVNFFASWCPPCEAENDILLTLKSTRGLAIYGINYKDSVSGRRDFLQRLGNPYVAVAPDPDGTLKELWGAVGVPQTYVIDANGRIRYRHAAPLTQKDIDETLLPVLRAIPAY